MRTGTAGSNDRPTVGQLSRHEKYIWQTERLWQVPVQPVQWPRQSCNVCSKSSLTQSARVGSFALRRDPA